VTLNKSSLVGLHDSQIPIISKTQESIWFYGILFDFQNLSCLAVYCEMYWMLTETVGNTWDFLALRSMTNMKLILTIRKWNLLRFHIACNWRHTMTFQSHLCKTFHLAILWRIVYCCFNLSFINNLLCKIDVYLLHKSIIIVLCYVFCYVNKYKCMSVRKTYISEWLLVSNRSKSYFLIM